MSPVIPVPRRKERALEAFVSLNILAKRSSTMLFFFFLPLLFSHLHCSQQNCKTTGQGAVNSTEHPWVRGISAARLHWSQPAGEGLCVCAWGEGGEHGLCFILVLRVLQISWAAGEACVWGLFGFIYSTLSQQQLERTLNMLFYLMNGNVSKFYTWA